MNLQHDCHRGECDTSGSQYLHQEREVTARSRTIVRHRDQTHFIINTQSLHNYCHIARAIPSHLHGTSFNIPDPVGLRNQAASLLRDKKQQQIEARKAISMASVMGRAEAPSNLANARHGADSQEAPSEPSIQTVTHDYEPVLRLPQAEEATPSKHTTMQNVANNNEPVPQLSRVEEAPLQSHFPSGVPVFFQPSTSASGHVQGAMLTAIPITL